MALHHQLQQQLQRHDKPNKTTPMLQLRSLQVPPAARDPDQTLRSTPAFSATWDLLSSLNRSELLPLHASAASFVAHFRAIHDTATPPQASSTYTLAGTTQSSWLLPDHIDITTLRRQEQDWDSLTLPPASQVRPPQATSDSSHQSLPRSLPILHKTEHSVFDIITAWLQEGRCATPAGHLNLKQAAYLLLAASWLQATLNHNWGLTSSTVVPFRCSLLLGGPGTGKTYITNLITDLIHLFLPNSTARAAFTHRAAKLIDGDTLHASLALPLDITDTSATAKSLGHQRETLQAAWRPISTFLIDEASMLSNEMFAQTDLRLRQIFNNLAVSWGGLALRLSGDFHQLPPVGATCLINPPQTIATAELTGTWLPSQTLVATGADLWNNLKATILLDHSHRCTGPLHDLLHGLLSDASLSTTSWTHLQARCIRSQDPRLQEPKFHPHSCPVGVMRHTIRAFCTVQRAQNAAIDAGHRLLLAIAADRCSFANKPYPLSPALALQAASLHTLSTTANLQTTLYLFRGLSLCLEAKLCTSLGLVRGCTVIVDDILLADEEPCLSTLVFISNAFPTISFLSPNISHPSLPYPLPSFFPARYFDHDSRLPPHPLLYLPIGLILRVPDATWIKHAALGPGRFFLGTTTRPWRFYPDIPPADGVQLDKDERAYMQLHRCQLPVSNLFAMTAYGLQGQTLPAIILDLARPPSMKLESCPPLLFLLFL